MHPVPTATFLRDIRWRIRHRDRRETTLAICAIFRDEAPYLAEWLAFHHLMGVERFYLYNNRSADDWEPVVRPYVDAGLVVLVDWPAVAPAAQFTAYRHCLLTTRGHVRHLAFLDIDEFLFSPSGDSLANVIGRFDRAPGFAIRWHVYGTSDLHDRPSGLLIENFLRRAADDHDLAQYGKPIVMPGRTFTHVTSPHVLFHPSRARPWRTQPTPMAKPGDGLDNLLRINHYYAKSVSEAYQRWERGAITRTDNHVRLLYQRTDPSLNEVEDPVLADLAPAVRDEMRSRETQPAGRPKR